METKVDNELEKDKEACAKEIAPILAKHNLKLDAKLISFNNAIMAIPDLTRAKK